jgi:undecaprenyl diphosphate synthase
MAQSTLHLPDHFAVIMDGNGRWAEHRGKARSVGHVAGARAMRDVVSHCARVGIAQLTLYAFSSDNWSRPSVEVRALLALFTSHFRSQSAALARAGVRLTVIGRRTRLPLTLRSAIRDAEAATARGTGMHLRVAIDYSSRDAIQRAHLSPCDALHIAADPADGSSLLPPVDLLLRTGGERRLSDFLLWECAYAELLFIDVLWPDITASVLDQAFSDFAARDRRFGRLSQRASA